MKRNQQKQKLCKLISSFEQSLIKGLVVLLHQNNEINCEIRICT